jgi:hypothetical protein
MVEVAEVTEVAQHRRAVPGLPVVARGEAMAGAVSWVTADLIGQINLYITQGSQ